jgi:hypothetical protein
VKAAGETEPVQVQAEGQDRRVQEHSEQLPEALARYSDQGKSDGLQ